MGLLSPTDHGGRSGRRRRRRRRILSLSSKMNINYFKAELGHQNGEKKRQTDRQTGLKTEQTDRYVRR